MYGAKQAKKVFLGTERQHRRLRRTPMWRALTWESGKPRTRLKGYTELNGIRRVYEAKRAKTARGEA
jgi:hypothetical protein